MVVSSRVMNAKSERYIKTGRKGSKSGGFWQGIRKQLAAHPVVVALIFFIMVFSGVASFFLYLPAQRHQLAMGGMYTGGGEE